MKRSWQHTSSGPGLSSLSHLSDAKSRLLQRYLVGDLPEASCRASITRRLSGTVPPLSLGQQQVWVREQTARDEPPFYNESITIHRNGPLNLAALKRSFIEIIRRHEIWRTTFDTVSGQPVQIIHMAPPRFSLPVVDLRDVPETKRQREALRVATEDARKEFNLKKGPLVRATLVRLDDEEYCLFLTMHQIIVDGVSVYSVFPTELVTLYEAFSAGRPSPLPELALQYADFACWQRQNLKGKSWANQVTYWRKKLAGELPVLPWPSDHRRPAIQTYRGAIHPFKLSKSLSSALRELSQAENVTLFMVLVLTFTALLHRYTGQEDIIVGTVASPGRKHTELQGLLGYFINPVALRFDLSCEPSFRELFCQARELTSGALAHDDIPLEHLTEELKVRPDPSRNPFFDLVISFVPMWPDLASGWSMTPMDAESGGAKWDLYLELNDRQEGIIGRAQYNPDLFDSTTIARFLEHLEVVMKCATANPRQRCSEFPLPT